MFLHHPQQTRRHWKRLAGMLILSLMLGLTAGFAQASDEAPDPNELYFRDDITHGGTGCPQGTVVADVSEDGLAVTLTFDEYFAEVGPDTSSRPKFPWQNRRRVK